MGDMIVYQTSDNNIYIFDITSRKTEKLVSKKQSSDFICCGDKVYYMIEKNDQIYLFNEYDSQTKTTRTIKEVPNVRFDFTIINGRIYYIDKDKMNLNMINITDGTTEQILPHIIIILGSFHQFIIYHTVSKEDPYSSEIKAYDTINGNDFLIGTTSDELLEICNNDDNLFLLTNGTPHYERDNGNDLYYIYRTSFSDENISLNKIMEFEYNSFVE
jgi:hypothetical protein